MDLGTAYPVSAVLDESGNPTAGEWQFAQVFHDDLVVDFICSTDLLHSMKARVERRVELKLVQAASGFPPGVPQAKVCAINAREKEKSYG